MRVSQPSLLLGAGNVAQVLAAGRRDQKEGSGLVVAPPFRMGDLALLYPLFQLWPLISGQQGGPVHVTSPMQPEVTSRDRGCLSWQWWHRGQNTARGHWS